LVLDSHLTAAVLPYLQQLGDIYLLGIIGLAIGEAVPSEIPACIERGTVAGCQRVRVGPVALGYPDLAGAQTGKVTHEEEEPPAVRGEHRVALVPV